MSTGRDNPGWVHPAGSLADGPWDCVVDGSLPGWTHTGLRVATLGPGEEAGLTLSGQEAVVVPLSGGGLTVEVATPTGRTTVELTGREHVLAGPTAVLYAPVGSVLTLRGSGSGPVRAAVCLARVSAPGGREPRHLAAAEVPVELRGAGTASRQVRNFGVPGVLDADRIIACEVVTPAGNWSSWPPHKHDEERPGVETELEEIYYVESAATDPRGTDAMGYLRVYGTAGRPLDVLAEVRSGDVVLVPHGWHGPAIAAPDADLYYLNVMAGPGAERAWLICDDPAHAWVRDTWAGLPPDPRLTSSPAPSPASSQGV